MAKIRSKDSKPEMVVRRLIHGMGLRYRLHVHGLCGKPDLVFSRIRKAIFVHGCFWHRHCCNEGRRVPKSRPEYWIPKIAGNVRRDRLNQKRLRRAGWSVLVLWECEINQVDHLTRRVERFLRTAG